MKIWTPERIDRAIAVLRATPKDRLAEACAGLSQEFGFNVTRDAVEFGIRRYGGTTLQRELGLDVEAARLAAQDVGATQRMPAMSFEEAGRVLDETDADAGTEPPIARGHEDFARLAKLAKKYERKGGLSLEALCDELRLTPREGRTLAERAIEAGYRIGVHDGVLGFKDTEDIPAEEVHVEGPSIALGEEIAIGVVSDPHFASKHHERSALCRHIEFLYEHGVRHIFGPGDWVAGGYRFLKYEVTHAGIEDQSSQVSEFIKQCGPEFTWHAIAGNHCESHDVGIDAAKMIEQQLRASGWTNFHYHGARAARLRFGPTRIAMHHPGGGLAYALSYKIQKYIDAMPLAERPHFLFTGHTHQKLWIERGGVNGFLCGTFENGDSSFGRMLGGEVQVGGWLVRYRHDEHGNVPDVTMTFRHQPHRRMNYIQVPA